VQSSVTARRTLNNTSMFMRVLQALCRPHLRREGCQAVVSTREKKSYGFLWRLRFAPAVALVVGKSPRTWTPAASTHSRKGLAA